MEDCEFETVLPSQKSGVGRYVWISCMSVVGFRIIGFYL